MWTSSRNMEDSGTEQSTVWSSNRTGRLVRSWNCHRHVKFIDFIGHFINGKANFKSPLNTVTPVLCDTLEQSTYGLAHTTRTWYFLIETELQNYFGFCQYDKASFSTVKLASPQIESFSCPWNILLIYAQQKN